MDATPDYCQPADIKGIELLSCRRGDLRFPPHLHKGYNIWLNTTGGEYFRFRGNTDIVGPGSFGMVNPGEVHANEACEGTARHLRSFYVDAGLLNTIAEHTGKRGTEQIGFHKKIFQDKKNYVRLSRLHTLLTQSENFLERQSCLIETLSDLVIRYGQARVRPETGRIGRKRLKHLIDYLHDNMAGKISVDELAAITRCTPFHLIRMFKKETGMPPHAYLVQIRLERAKQLLKQGLGISHVAFETGFADQSHFTRLFKRNFGLTPKAYVRQILS